MKQVIIVGGGASGIMASIFAAKNGAKVSVLEKNDRPLKKLLLTGNGRCNLTNLVWDGSVLRGSCVEKAYKIIDRFDCIATLEFFKSIGLYTKDREGWVYPVNDSAFSVARILLYEAERLHVNIKTNQEVISIEKKIKENQIVPDYKAVTQGWEYEADALVISAGSSAHLISDKKASSANERGCDITLKTAKKYGIGCKSFLPALTALKSNKNGIAKWDGVRIRAKINLICDGDIKCSKTGQLQLTEYGISGIPVFELSRYAVDLYEKNKKVCLSIDFLPDFSKEELINAILLAKRQNSVKTDRMILLGLINEKLVDHIVSCASERGGAAPEKYADIIKNYLLPISGYLGTDKAQVCMGGVDLNDLSDKLEAKNSPGLFFTGEAVDIDGTCGGYNLQWAWSSGWAAGSAAARTCY